MDNYIRVAQETHTEPIKIPSIVNINLHDYHTTGTHVLAFTDSSITLGWIHKVYFYPVNA